MEDIFLVLEIIGTVAFALSGAMQAIEHKVDLLGVVLLGMTTALGGGVMRDITRGIPVPLAFSPENGYLFVILAFSVSLLVFCAAFFLRGHYEKEKELISRINNVFDALGLGAFAISGARIAITAGFGENWLFVFYLSLLSAVGGGIIRDVLLSEIPFVLKKRIYVLAALGGTVAYVLLLTTPLPEGWCAAIGVGVVFLVRMLATRLHWNLPTAIK